MQWPNGWAEGMGGARLGGLQCWWLAVLMWCTGEEHSCLDLCKKLYHIIAQTHRTKQWPTKEDIPWYMYCQVHVASERAVPRRIMAITLGT